MHRLRAAPSLVQECSVGPLQLALLEAGTPPAEALPVIVQLRPGSHFTILGPHLSTFRQFSAQHRPPRGASSRHSVTSQGSGFLDNGLCHRTVHVCIFSSFVQNFSASRAESEYVPSCHAHRIDNGVSGRADKPKC